MAIKVAIYEDNLALRETLSEIIRSNADFELAGEFGHCLDVLQNCEAYKPDVIIMDIDMPGRTGIEGLKSLKAVYPTIEVIMNTVFDDDDRIFNAIREGATGYLLKKSTLNNLINSIIEVVNGGAPMSPSIARRVMQFQNSKQSFKEGNKLSERELEIINLLATGMSYKMVASECIISIDTVRTYIKRIYEKLQVHSVTEAVHKVFIQK